jgi:hypothetical protein
LTVVGIAVVAGCAKSVVPEYELRRDSTLAPPPPAADGWRPDAVVALSPSMLEKVVQLGLDRSGSLKKKVDLGGRAFITPSLQVSALKLSEGRACPACLRVDADLTGTVSWRIGNSSGEQPLGGDLGFELELEARRDGWTWEVVGRPRAVSDAKLEIDGRTFKTVEKLAEGAVQDWAQNHVFESMPPLVVARMDVADLPLRAVRAVSGGEGGVRLELLTESQQAAPVLPPPSVQAGEDWAMVLAESALLHVLRKEAFAMGPLTHGVAIEPTGLDLQDKTFDLHLRLWRIEGRSWWRDVSTRGTWEPTDRGFRLSAVAAKEIDQSKRAGLADPLAALVEGRILAHIEEAIETTLPGGREGTLGGVPVEARVTRVKALGDGLAVGGTARVGSGGKAPPPKRVGP